MNPFEPITFGYLIAFVLPGFVATLALAYLIPPLNTALTTLATGENAAGPIFFVTVSSLTVGVSLNAVRRVILDRLLDTVEPSRPKLDYARLSDDKRLIFKDALEGTYRPYEFVANMTLALGLLFLVRLGYIGWSGFSSSGITIMVGAVAVLLLGLAHNQHKETYRILNKIIAGQVSSQPTAAPGVEESNQPTVRTERKPGIKRAVLIAAIFLSLVAVLHVLRLVFQVEVTTGGTEIPMWASVLGVVVPSALALWLWREQRS